MSGLQCKQFIKIVVRTALAQHSSRRYPNCWPLSHAAGAAGAAGAANAARAANAASAASAASAAPTRLQQLITTKVIIVLAAVL